MRIGSITTLQVNDRSLEVRMAPGSGARLTVKMNRFGNKPTLNFAWEGVATG